MYRITVLGIVCGMLIATEAGEAQIVRWGPSGGVSIRAPFVDVDVGPSGDTHVRAPFTAVDTPGFRPVAPRYGYRSAPLPSNQAFGRRTTRLRPLTTEEFSQGAVIAPRRTPTDPAQMSWIELRRHTRAAALRLENGLRRVADGRTWIASLRPGTVRDLLAEEIDEPPSPATRDQLAMIQQSYTALADSQGYPQIARLSGFHEMRQALTELVMPPEERLRQGLAMQWSALHADLGQFETGGTWQEYLSLPPTFEDSQVDSRQMLRQLEELLDRYEQVIGPEQYRAVAQLASFQATRRTLAAYVDLLRNSVSTGDSAATELEAIPSPRPLP